VALVPTPGVDAVALREFIEQSGIPPEAVSWIVRSVQRRRAGELRGRPLGIMPSISASIILNWTAVIPALERLAREGDTDASRSFSMAVI
jgi:preprotein translocase subunit SecY